MNLWISDPKTGEKSVTLTFLTLSFAALFIISILTVVGQVESTGAFEELLYSTAALYFGRRVTVGNKSYSSDKEDSQEKK